MFTSKDVSFERGYLGQYDQVSSEQFSVTEPLVGLQGYVTSGPNSVLKSLGFFKYNCTVEGTV